MTARLSTRLCLVAAFAAVFAAAEPGPSASPNDANCFTQNFDGVAAPNLPNGWNAFNIQGASPAWVTDAGAADTPPNSAYVPDSFVVSDKVLVSPPISIMSQTAVLSFWSNFDFSSAGGVLEYSLFNIGVFGDITQSGGTFTAGGYNTTILRRQPALREAGLGRSVGPTRRRAASERSPTSPVRDRSRTGSKISIGAASPPAAGPGRNTVPTPRSCVSRWRSSS